MPFPSAVFRLKCFAQLEGGEEPESRARRLHAAGTRPRKIGKAQRRIRKNQRRTEKTNDTSRTSLTSDLEKPRERIGKVSRAISESPGDFSKRLAGLFMERREGFEKRT